MTQAYIRGEDGKLKLVDVPEWSCPVRGCGQTLHFIRERYQRGLDGQVAWDMGDNNHQFLCVQGTPPSVYNRSV